VRADWADAECLAVKHAEPAGVQPCARVEVRTTLHDGSMLLVLEISDANTRLSTAELEIVRITKRRRLADRLFSLGSS
jgi:hypothetical protein